MKDENIESLININLDYFESVVKKHKTTWLKIVKEVTKGKVVHTYEYSDAMICCEFEELMKKVNIKIAELEGNSKNYENRRDCKNYCPLKWKDNFTDYCCSSYYASAISEHCNVCDVGFRYGLVGLFEKAISEGNFHQAKKYALEISKLEVREEVKEKVKVKNEKLIKLYKIKNEE